MGFLLLIPAVFGVLALVGATVIRRATIDPDAWHVDPTTAPPTGNPNWYRLTPDSAPADRDASRDGTAPVYACDVSTLATAFNKVALTEDRVEVLAGVAKDGFVTYVQRSAFFAFPDYISVTFSDAADGGSTLAVFSRSQYGKSDLGVNEKRVNAWVNRVSNELS